MTAPRPACTVCHQPVVVVGIDRLPVQTAGLAEQWVHDGACYHQWVAPHLRPNDPPSARASSSCSDRARAAGGLP
jgi:hypothetical protein